MHEHHFSTGALRNGSNLCHNGYAPLCLPQSYSRDVFLFVFVVLLCVAYGASLQHYKTPLLLNRPQTEEWKGWMQVGCVCGGRGGGSLLGCCWCLLQRAPSTRRTLRPCVLPPPESRTPDDAPHAAGCAAGGAHLGTRPCPRPCPRPKPPLLPAAPPPGPAQVLFLLYHYFEAREYYNAIRIFIAGYVWMTGFGNFSYYYRSGDFSIGRWARAPAWRCWLAGRWQVSHRVGAALVRGGGGWGRRVHTQGPGDHRSKRPSGSGLQTIALKQLLRSNSIPRSAARSQHISSPSAPPPPTHPGSAR
jgi:hypothetical protein